MWIEGRLVENNQTVRLQVNGATIGNIEAVNLDTSVWIAPGWIDIQVNGYGGYDVNAPGVTPESIIALTRLLWQRGVTAFCPTVITASEEAICHSLEAIALACERDQRVAHAIPCIHVEGPAISREDGPRGAHPRSHVRAPDIAEYRRWQVAAKGRIGLVTLAPEYPQAREYIQALNAENVVVAIGHTAASSEQIQEAVNAGARLATHLGNGAHAQLKRHPNYIWEQLAEDRLLASFICDGHHLAPAVMKAMLRAKGIGSSILISDAVAVAGLAPGLYETPVGGKVELLANGRLNLYGTPLLAGSVSSLPECLANVLRYTDTTLSEGVRMVSTHPGQLLQLDAREKRGSVVSGSAADLTLFRFDAATGDIIIETTLVQGEVVYQRLA
ncbi:N-acetylglucosamine-6-phosphate deacetylase [Ktedonosporobacter rubrisoli]|uniref:N-acetylglucosamine-6-phosphate deacetylase n=1 Tax=Ktedonosporobacter rubrisoli TaxID=2509675 RepID=A0A4P6JHX0_KTERU|nr:N-acetylglucosamine-6-phosphate deacetylase [Ktedonosporobacter rubrisoli]QBD74637.1 N-acetylglucosamine-6-phosphate deacetylase [Ktedonosporobacter rubrisoli]